QLNDYAGGCLSEATEWTNELCPGSDPRAIISDSNQNNFGKILCGCGFNYGGPECDTGCPTEQLHFGGDNPDTAGFCEDGYCASVADESGLDGGRSGFWMCGDFAATSYAEQLPEVGGAFQGSGALQVGGSSLDGSFTVRGSVPVFGTDRTPMSGADEDGSTYTVR
ncbi:MAG: hypothetical protein AAFS10_05880, partial [Myxococcota bacterium]